MMNPHMYLLTKALRSSKCAPLMAARGGGGHFHKPDPPLLKEFKHTRKIPLEDINQVLYHDFAPEYHMHLHSPNIESGKKGWALIGIYFTLILLPCWLFGAWLHKKAGAQPVPSVRPGRDHQHMGGALIRHLMDNNYEDKADFLGRRTAFFYKNPTKQMNEIGFKPPVFESFERHGFKF